MKYILIFAIAISVWCYYLNYRVDTLKKQNARLEAEKNSLSLVIKDYKNAQMEADKTIKTLRDAVEKNKENLDWYNDRVPYDVLDIMQKQYNGNKTN